MKKFSFFVMLAVLVSVGAMSYFSRLAVTKADIRIAQAGDLLNASKITGSLAYELEKFRTTSSRFKYMMMPEVKNEIVKARQTFHHSFETLNKYLLEDEKKKASEISDQLENLVNMNEKLVGTLFSRNPYGVEEVRNLHDEIQARISELGAGVQNRGQALVQLASRSADSQSRIFFYGGAVILLLFLSVLLMNYRIYFKPLKSLYVYAVQFETKKTSPEQQSDPEGMHGAIHSALSKLAASADGQMRERHKFILDIFSDLAAPLKMLRAGKELLATSGEAAQFRAMDAIKRGIAVLSGSLEDLVDLAEIGKLDSRLNEKLIDLSELVMNVSRTLAGADQNKQMVISVPPMPIWMKGDARRLERVFTHVVLKVSNTLGDDGRVRISLSDPSQQNLSGLEILIQDAQKGKEGRSSGPELDITRHWISDSGLTMALARKIIRAHGGTITASGVSGTSAQIRIKLPSERIVTRGLINPPTGLEVDYAQLTANMESTSSVVSVEGNSRVVES